MSLSIIDLCGQCHWVSVLSKRSKQMYRCEEPVVTTVNIDTWGIPFVMIVGPSVVALDVMPVCKGHLSLAKKNAKKYKIPLYP